MVLKTWPLCTSAKSSLRDRVLGEVERNSFVVFARQRGTPWAHALQNLGVPTWGGFGEEFLSNGFSVELLIRIRVFAGPACL